MVRQQEANSCGPSSDLSAVAECRITRKVSGKEIPCCGKFLADEAQPEEPCPHGIFGILILLRFRACRLHFLCHLAERKAKLDVTLKLSCVQAVLLPIRRGIELEKPEFDGPFVKVAW